ncbi:esterase [Hanstruepera neustonica]|uniref:Esterase n=1 Tax=Hanstruepera neustonica TaxID=1445657 RepID=A0A2K1DXM1_9FLAO|nr:alpha/beta hydrolase-fold protein [Hanstruepera neustonica]PNQ72763.1 esterase [Hanstruepera neustonica]
MKITINKRRTVLVLLLSMCYGVITGQTNAYLSQVGKKDSLYSQVLKESRTIYVQLPESYHANPNQKYPVVYILDGEVFLPTLTDVHHYYSGGFMPEMVLVGISNAENRTRDLTTSKITEMYGMPYKEEHGEAKNFLKFIETELIPYVETSYPVTNYRTLIGHSYGGLFTVYSLVHRPKLFANYLAIDPSLDWDDQKLVKEAKAILPQKDLSNKTLFMSLNGQLNMLDETVTIDNVMEDTSDFTIFARSNVGLKQFIQENKQNNLQFTWQFYPKEIHGTIPQPSIKDGMIALFEWFQMENTYAINNPETPIEALEGIIEHRADKLESHFGYAVPPYPEELLNMSGYMNMDMGQLDKSKLYFEKAMEYYPNSANAYDSMADYYEFQKDYTNALKYVSKAYEISGSEYHGERMAKFKM